MARITTVGLDADDTLWHNETIFRLTQDRFVGLLAPYADEAALRAGLAEVERRNLRLYGYGVKGFILSMLETAHELAPDADLTPVTREILACGREMLAHPVEALPDVPETLAILAERYRLVLITKGDLMHQENKVAASGLGELFAAVEIVSEKDAATYARVFTRYGAGPAEAAMVGNSLRSDVLPALEAGAFGAYVPYHVTWAHEVADPPADDPRYVELDSISHLPAWLERMQRESA